jgi:hypothetical protein
MKASLDSSAEVGNLASSCDPTSVEPTFAEEVRVFRAGIVQWAARYVAQLDVVESADACAKASADLRGWSRDYFSATKNNTEARGANP